MLGCAIVFGAAQIARGVMLFTLTGRGRAAELSLPRAPGPTALTPRARQPGDLPSLYTAVRGAIAAQFPGARGTIRLRAATGSDGAIAQLEVGGEHLDSGVKRLAARMVGASGLRFAEKNALVSLPDLKLGESNGGY